MSSNFWTTLPGILTGIGGVLAGCFGLVKVFIPDNPSPSHTSTVASPQASHSSATIPQPSIIVAAKSDQGTPYQNPYDHTVKVKFTAAGEWQAIPKDAPGDLPKGYITADGAGGFSANPNRRCPGFSLGALIVSTDQEKCLAADKQGTFDLQPHQTANFLMNDVTGGYGDNAGNLQVNLALTKSESP